MSAIMAPDGRHFPHFGPGDLKMALVFHYGLSLIGFGTGMRPMRAS
jgi:hypothetical protein